MKVTRSGVGGTAPWEPCADNRAPIADPGQDMTGVRGEPIQFDGRASHDPDVGLGGSGRIRWYEWQFGDGYMARNSTVTHTYQTAGDYTVTLIVADGCDAVSQPATLTVAITDPPVADAGPDQEAEIGQPVTFDGTDSFDPDGSIVDYNWSFGDGETGSGPTMTHTYALTGLFVATLIVTDDSGATAKDTLFVNITDSPCAGNQPPIAEAGPNQTGQTGQGVTFDGSGSSDPDPPAQQGGSIDTYDWNFGDGQTGSGQSVTHIYSAAATYTVTLTVTDDCEATSDAATALVAITDAPTAIIEGPEDGEGEVGSAIPFDGSLSNDPDGSIVAWDWIFGDGSTGSGPTMTHTYGAADTYTVTLTVTDDFGATDADTMLVTITDPPPPGGLTAAFVVKKLVSVDPDGTEHWGDPINLETEEIELGLRVKFDGSTSGGLPAYHTWYFGDGTWGQGQDPLHAFEEPGTYTVVLTVDNATWTESDSVTKTVHVDGGMEFLSIMSPPERAFTPKTSALVAIEDGTEVWSISYTGDLGVADISDPYSPETLQLLTITEPLNLPRSMVSHAGLLYIANGTAGVPIFDADRNACDLVGRITAGDLGENSADFVATVGDVLYVASTLEGQVYVFSLTDPASPARVTTLDLPGGIAGMSTPGGDYVIVRESWDGPGDTTVVVIDVRDPLDPDLLDPLILPGTGFGVVHAGPSVSGIAHTTGIRLIDVLIDAGGAMFPRLAGGTDHGSDYFIATASRLYVVQGNVPRILKYDIANTSDPYLMESLTAAATGLTDPFLFDPDGPGGPIQPSLVVGTQGYGYAMYKP